MIVRMQVGDSHMLLSRITRISRDHLGLIAGMHVCAQVKNVALMACNATLFYLRCYADSRSVFELWRKVYPL